MLFKDDYIKIIIEELQQKTLEELQIIHDFVKGNGTIKQYLLTEIDFDTSLETEKSLIRVAQEHCSSYDDERTELLPIDTLEKAINYFNSWGFEVAECSEQEAREFLETL